MSDTPTQPGPSPVVTGPPGSPVGNLQQRDHVDFESDPPAGNAPWVENSPTAGNVLPTGSDL